MKAKLPKTTRVPIYRDSGFHLVDIPTMKQAFADELQYPRDPNLYIYGRYRNPNVVAAEDLIMDIEGSQWSVIAQSGLAAIDIALSIFQKQDQNDMWLFFSEIYGGTNQFIDNVLVRRRGINAVRFNPTGNDYSIEDFEQALILHKPTVVFFEAVSNPMLITIDAEAFISVAKKHGAKVIVDNTFASPYLWKPLGSGANIVIHSVTKYLAGHGNISGGVLSGNDPELLKLALEYRKLVGHMMSPDDAARLCDQLKTFELRFERHCRNAFILASYLTSHPAVEKVLYPGLESHPTHNNAFKLFNGKGFGAIITIDLAGKTNKIKADRCNQLIGYLSDSIPLVPTLGDTETILMPIEPVWGDKFPFPGMIRFSIGIENSDKLLKTLSNALNSLQ
jgi:cystathionine beta-lyase/cystathionine gamma-synthase